MDWKWKLAFIFLIGDNYNIKCVRVLSISRENMMKSVAVWSDCRQLNQDMYTPVQQG